MKHKIWRIIFLLGCFAILTAGCTSTTEERTCAKCGREATSTISGPIEILKSNGIPISACRKITSTVYSADICDSCTGPVAEIKPDP